MDTQDAAFAALCERYYDEVFTDEHKGRAPLGNDKGALPVVLSHNTPNNSGDDSPEGLASAMNAMKQSKYDTNHDGICDAPECKNILAIGVVGAQSDVGVERMLTTAVRSVLNTLSSADRWWGPSGAVLSKKCSRILSSALPSASETNCGPSAEPPMPITSTSMKLPLCCVRRTNSRMPV